MATAVGRDRSLNLPGRSLPKGSCQGHTRPGHQRRRPHPGGRADTARRPPVLIMGAIILSQDPAVGDRRRLPQPTDSQALQRNCRGANRGHGRGAHALSPERVTAQSRARQRLAGTSTCTATPFAAAISSAARRRFGDRFGGDRPGHHRGREHTRFVGVSSSCGATALTRIPCGRAPAWLMLPRALSGVSAAGRR